MDGWGFEIDKCGHPSPTSKAVSHWEMGYTHTPCSISSLKRPSWIHPKTTFLDFILTGSWLLGPLATSVQRPQVSPASFRA